MKQLTNKLKAAFLCLALLWAWSPLQAAPPQKVGFQGRLTDTSDAPLSGSYDITFSLYDSPSGGSVLWSETQYSVSVVNGALDTELGASTPIPYTASAVPSYLEISVDGEILYPRQSFNSVLYSYNSYMLGGRAPEMYVDTYSTQTVMGVKTFSADPVFNAGAIPQAAVSGLESGLAGLNSSTASLQSQIDGISTGDNLGDHVASMDLSMSSYSVTDAYMVTAQYFYGDGSGLTGVTGSGDNLGSHIATTSLNMAGYNINNLSDINAAEGTFTLTHSTSTVFKAQIGGVGIGTGSPGLNATAAYGNILHIYDDTQYQYPGIFIEDNDIAPGTRWFIHAHGDGRDSFAIRNDKTGYEPFFIESGRVGIGTDDYDPNAALHVLSSAAFATDNVLAISTGLPYSPSTVMAVKGDGKVGIGTKFPSYQLTVDGPAGYSGTIVSVSTGSSQVISLLGTGDIVARAFYGDGSGLTGVTGTGDNLGDHTATMDLDMSSYSITSVMTVMAGDVYAENLNASGSVNAAYFYGDGSNLTGIVSSGTADNLGNHTATMDLDMSSYAVVNVSSVTTDVMAVTGGTFAVFSGTNTAAIVQGAQMGIGTGAPGLGATAAYGNILHIYDYNQYQYPGIFIEDDDVPGARYFIHAHGDGVNSFAIRDDVTMYEPFYIEDNRVGIGMNDFTPLASLHVMSTAPAAGIQPVLLVSTGLPYLPSNVMSVTADGDIVAVGSVTASYFVGDGSMLTGISGSGDNLGNHIATTSLDMSYFSINNIASMTVTGDSFSVGGSTFVVKNGYVGIGTDSPASPLDVVTTTPINVSRHAYDNFPATLNLVRARGTYAVPEALADGDQIGGIGFRGYEGSIYQTFGVIDSVVDGTVSAGTIPTAIRLLTASSGSGAVERLRVTSTGFVGISTGAPQAALDVLSDGVYAQIWRNAAGTVVASMTSTGILYGTSASGDNLGNHIATQNLDMSSNVIVNALAVYGGYFYGDGSNITGITDSGAVQKTGDTMPGYLTIAYSSLTVIGDTLVTNYSLAAGTGTTPSHLYVSTSGFTGIGTLNPQARLDVLSTGTGPTIYAQKWRNGTGGVVAQMDSEGLLGVTSLSVEGGTFWAQESNISTLTVTNAVTAAAFYGDGSNLTDITDSGAVQKTGDTMPGYLTIAYSSLTVIGDTLVTNYSLAAGTGTTPSHLYVSTSGAVGIGMLNPEAALDVKSTGAASTAQYWRDETGSPVAMVTSSGDFYGLGFYGSGAGLSDLSGEFDSHFLNTASTAGYAMNGVTILRSSASLYSLFAGEFAGSVNAGLGNVFVGYEAGMANTSGVANTFMGLDSGYTNTTGSQNTFLGTDSGYSNSIGEANVFVGADAGYTNSIGMNNVFVGRYSGEQNISGSSNTLVGYSAGSTLTTGGNNIIIGANQQATSATVSDELNIGGLIYGDLNLKTVGIGTNSPMAALDVVSTTTEVTAYAQVWRSSDSTMGAVMTTGGVLAVAALSVTEGGSLYSPEVLADTVSVAGHISGKGFSSAIQEVNLSGSMSSFAADGSGLVYLNQLDGTNAISTITGCNDGTVAEGQKVLFMVKSHTAGTFSVTGTMVGSLSADNIVVGAASFLMSDGSTALPGTTAELVCSTVNSTKVWVVVSSSVSAY